MKYLKDFFIDLFQQLDFSLDWATIFSISIALIALLLVSALAQIVTRVVLVKIIHHFVEKTNTDWDDYLIKRKVFGALAHLPSAFIIYSA